MRLVPAMTTTGMSRLGAVTNGMVIRTTGSGTSAKANVSAKKRTGSAGGLNRTGDRKRTKSGAKRTTETGKLRAKEESNGGDFLMLVCLPAGLWPHFVVVPRRRIRRAL